MRQKDTEPNHLRKTLSSNIKKQRKILGLTQEKLAEAASLSFQTINDIEGCRMWVSDKTILKLAQVLHMEPHQLLEPVTHQKSPARGAAQQNGLLIDLESKIIKFIKRQFEEANTKYEEKK